MKQFKIKSSYDGVVVIRLQNEEKPIGFVKKIWAADRLAHNIGREKKKKVIRLQSHTWKSNPRSSVKAARNDFLFLYIQGGERNG